MYIVSTQRKIITLLFIAPSLHEAPRPLIIPTADDRLWSVLYWWHQGPGHVMRLQTEQEALIISDCSAGNISFYPGAWSSECLHLRIIPLSRARVSRHKHPSWSMMRRAATRSDTSAPHIQSRAIIRCDQWCGAVSLSPPSARVSRDQVLTPDTKHWQAPHSQRAAFTPGAIHTKSAQNIALQSPCIKLVDVWLFATHGARRRGYFVEEICTASNIGF